MRYWKIVVGSVLLALVAVYPIARKGNRKPFVPTDNPVAKYNLAWTNALPWKRAVDLLDFDGKTPTERFAKAQQYLTERGGGVIYFPPGVYRFQDDLVLKTGIILRGVTPSEDAKDKLYFPRARLEFPRYAPEFSGQGSPKNSAFKVIRLEKPASASNIGLVNLGINRARIVFGEGKDGKIGNNRLVYGCTLTNATGISETVPDLTLGQHPWQRYNDDHSAAIEVRSEQNAMIANNRISGDYPDDFTMDGYVLRDSNGQTRTVDGVVFDFNNRPGIQLTNHSKKGGVIRDNFIYATESAPIGSPVGTVLINNTLSIHEPRRLTDDGIHLSGSPPSGEARR